MSSRILARPLDDIFAAADQLDDRKARDRENGPDRRHVVWRETQTSDRLIRRVRQAARRIRRRFANAAPTFRSFDDAAYRRRAV